MACGFSSNGQKKEEEEEDDDDDDDDHDDDDDDDLQEQSSDRNRGEFCFSSSLYRNIPLGGSLFWAALCRSPGPPVAAALVAMQELLDGVLRLKGTAQAIDLATLMYCNKRPLVAATGREGDLYIDTIEVRLGLE